jgi:hypothetical protein
MTEHLRELAELAAALDHNEHPEWYSSDYLEGIGVLSYPKNARFMAAASPAAVLALITEIGRLTACLKTANSNHEKFERKWYLACDERDAYQQAADTQAMAHKVERDGLTTLIDKALYALEYASDMTKPEGLGGCDCPICTTIFQINETKGKQ